MLILVEPRYLQLSQMVVGCVQHYSTHYSNKLGKSLEPFFHKVQKTAKRAKKGDFIKISNIYEEKGHATFEPLWMPKFMPSFRKILRAFFEKSCYVRTDGRTRVIL